MKKENNEVLDFNKALKEKNKMTEEENQIRARKSRKRQKRRRSLTYFVVAILLVCMVSVSAYNIISVKLEERALKKEKASLEDEKKNLKEELTLVNDPEYIEEQARKQLKLIMPGETLYVLPEKDEKAKDD